MIRIGITQGDIGGVGPEVIIKTLMDNRLTESYIFTVYGSSKAMAFYKPTIEGAENFSFSVVGSAAESVARRVNLVDCSSADIRISVGEATPEAGEIAIAALNRAADELKNGLLDVLVTAPINKEEMHSDGFKFTGHTEFLADRFGGRPLMMMCSDILKVGLQTIHLPVSEVAAKLTQDGIVDTLKRMRQSLRADFEIIEPRIAVLALNPHAGDGGLLGQEENSIIKPAVVEASVNGVLAFGPFAADGFFASHSYEKYDAVLAMYHDQGLTPFKTLSPYGVNFTAGLSVVRTSPDHGVGYDIAGKGVADESSMRNAIYMAVDILRSRHRAAEMSANPLRRYEREKGRDVSVKDLKLPEESND